MKSKHGKLRLVTLLIVVFIVALRSSMSANVDEGASRIIDAVLGDSTLSRISVDKSILWAYFLSKENAKWSMMAAPEKDIEAAKALYFVKSVEPTVQPFELKTPIGDDAAAWKSSRGGTIVFRRGSFVGIVAGALDWHILVNKAEILDKLFSTIPLEEAIREINRIEELNLAKQVFDDAKTNSSTGKDKVIEIGAIYAALGDKSLNDTQRSKVILEAAKLDDVSSAVDLVVSQLDKKYSLAVRSQAIKALGSLKGEKAVVPLVEILKQPITGDVKDEGTEEAILRRNAVVALGQIGDGSVVPLLQNIAASPKEHESVKELAVISARKIIEKKQAQ